MSQIDPLLLQKEWRLIDQSTLGPHFDALQSFAIDDSLCNTVGSQKSIPTIRSWVHHNTIVLGIQDSRLPYIQEGIEFLNEKGYRIIVRNSGGLAVVLDSGILNLSIILPESNGIDINRGYDAMWSLMKEMLSSYEVTIEAKEIVGSYCPGSYDLSIGDKKFAGISQRRLRGGVAVQIYLCTDKSGAERATLIKNFYDIALKNSESKFTYPSIRPETMASLSELLHEEVNAKSLMLTLFQTLKKHNQLIIPSQLTSEELELFQYNYDRLIKRNDKVL